MTDDRNFGSVPFLLITNCMALNEPKWVLKLMIDSLRIYSQPNKYQVNVMLGLKHSEEIPI